MRILVISQASWNTANSFGNTVTNWFECWEDTQFFHFFARHQNPNTDIVDKYYNVSAIEILKKSLKGKEAGTILDPSDIVSKENNNDANAEQEQIAKLHKKTNEFLYWGMETVWRLKKWINRNLDEFIEYANPDIIFSFATSPYILKPAIEYIKTKKPSVKVILWIADDILAGYEQNAWFRRGYLRSGINYCINSADKLYGASVEMCEKYSRIYGKQVTPLYKGCTFERYIKKRSNSPLRLVYAGNLLYGRLETINEVVKALKTINSDECKAVLEVYSNSSIDEKQKRQCFDETNALYMGSRSYEEIKVILNEADIVFHVESFEKEQIDAVKYSFSTKIIDCLQCGSAVVGIGPAGIASIEYIRNVDGAFVIDKKENIDEKIKQIINCNLIERAMQTRKYAVEKHSVENVRRKIHEDFSEVLGGQ